VYALLADLRRHWPLLGADLVEAGIVDGSGEESAQLLVRGPFPGLEREITTRVTHSVDNESFGGLAEAGRTIAAIDWELTDADDGGTFVDFSTTIEPGGRRDQWLVSAARPWLARRCRQVLRRLEQELDADYANSA
jgi:hypothetical protein